MCKVKRFGSKDSSISKEAKTQMITRNMNQKQNHSSFKQQQLEEFYVQVNDSMQTTKVVFLLLLLLKIKGLKHDFTEDFD